MSASQDDGIRDKEGVAKLGMPITGTGTPCCLDAKVESLEGKDDW